MGKYITFSDVVSDYVEQKAPKSAKNLDTWLKGSLRKLAEKEFINELSKLNRNREEFPDRKRRDELVIAKFKAWGTASAALKRSAIRVNAYCISAIEEPSESILSYAIDRAWDQNRWAFFEYLPLQTEELAERLLLRSSSFFHGLEQTDKMIERALDDDMYTNFPLIKNLTPSICLLAAREGYLDLIPEENRGQTIYDAWADSDHYSKNLGEVPAQYRTPELVTTLLEHDSYNIKYIENQTEELQLQALVGETKGRFRGAFVFQNPTEKVKEKILELQPGSIRYFDQTPEMILRALQFQEKYRADPNVSYWDDVMKYVNPKIIEEYIQKVGVEDLLSSSAKLRAFAKKQMTK